MTTQDDEFDIIFRRFRKTATGQLLDAKKYGLRAWPIKVKKESS